jgi:hypothetical protein
MYVHKPFLAVVGGLPPERLATLRGDGARQVAEQDGFLDRFLFSYPAELPAEEENWLSIAPETTKNWKDVVDKLRTLQMEPVKDETDQVRGQRPFVVGLTADGRQAWQDFTRRHAAEINDGAFADCLRGPWRKLCGYCARLALILHYLRWACGEVEGDKAAVDGESVRRAEKLVSYFKTHAKKVYALLDADPRAGAARKLLDWISQQNQATFTKRDTYRALRGLRCRTVEDVEPILTLLEKHGYVRPLPPVERHTAGRRPSPGYESHPALHQGHNGHNGQNPEADEDSVQSVQSVPGGEEDTDAAGEVWEGEVP